MEGRKNLFSSLQNHITTTGKTIWVHCSSLGEFEQGRPVIESLRRRYPDHKIFLSFFSPSGYEIRKNYPGADFVFYLPADSPSHARKLLDILRPSLVIFVKYDYWFYYLREIHTRKIPLLIVSSIFRPQQPFFKWYGGLHRKMLHFFTAVFVQDAASRDLLSEIGLTSQVIVAGDTRFDRVISIAANSDPLPGIERFCADGKILVAGSTWPPDELILSEVMTKTEGLRIILAPHEIDPAHIQNIQKLFPSAVLFSSLGSIPDLTGTDSLIIDNIGMLSSLYRYGTLTYVGGGFNAGIHNILEAVVYQKPVMFGPRYKKFREANDLVSMHTAFPVETAGDLKNRIEKLLANDEGCYYKAVENAGVYIGQNKDATAKIMAYIEENRLLTN